MLNSRPFIYLTVIILGLVGGQSILNFGGGLSFVFGVGGYRFEGWLLRNRF